MLKHTTRLFALLIALFLVSGLDVRAQQAPEPSTSGEQVVARPNIVLFLVDDLGWQDITVPFHATRTPFNEAYHTPHAQQLARQGRVFTNAYAASPVCTPTRTSIMTGRHPARTRITDWTLVNDVQEQRRRRPWVALDPPNWTVEGLQPHAVTLPDLLQEQGYRTIHAGKAHFGALDTPGANPTNLGFDVNIAGHAAGAPGSYYSEERYGNADPDSPWGVPGLEKYYGTGTYLTEALTLEANVAIEAAVRDGEPFFLNMAHYAVHTPIQADSQFIDHYQDLPPQEAAYASMIEGYDASLGAILQKLEELGVAENTLVLFMSDNGGLSAHSRGPTPVGTGANTHNLPLRSGKGSAYEGGTRVPMIAAWAALNPQAPAQERLPVAGGTRTDAPVISHDFFPTILQAAGVSVPEGYIHDGRSFLPLLADAEAPSEAPSGEERLLGWHYPHVWGPVGEGLEPYTAVRRGQWKLIYFYDGQRWELYDLDADLTETTNRVDIEPEVARRLARDMRDWMTRMDAQTPLDRGTGTPRSVPVAPDAE